MKTLNMDAPRKGEWGEFIFGWVSWALIMLGFFNWALN